MRILLLDTHTLLWWLASDERLPDHVAALIADPGSSVLASAASAWEISVKSALGKLDSPPDLLSATETTGVEWIAIEPADAMAAGQLPLHHRDPFDRLLVAQASARRAALVSRDRQLDAYDGVERLWSGTSDR